MSNVVSSVWPVHLSRMMIVINLSNLKRWTICSAFRCPLFVLVSRYEKVQLRFTVHTTSQRFSQTFCCCAFCWSRSKLCRLTQQIHHLVSAVSFAPCSLGVFSLVWGHADPTGTHRPSELWSYCTIAPYLLMMLFLCQWESQKSHPQPLPFSQNPHTHTGKVNTIFPLFSWDRTCIFLPSTSFKYYSNASPPFMYILRYH